MGFWRFDRLFCSKNGIFLQAISLRSDKTIHTARDLPYKDRIFMDRGKSLQTIEKARYSELMTKWCRDSTGKSILAWQAIIHQTDVTWFGVPLSKF